MQRCIDECSSAKYLLWVFSSLQNHVHVLTHYCCFFVCSLSNARFQFALDLGYMFNKSFFISSEFHSERVQVNTFFFLESVILFLFFPWALLFWNASDLKQPVWQAVLWLPRVFCHLRHLSCTSLSSLHCFRKLCSCAWHHSLGCLSPFVMLIVPFLV